MKITLDKSDRGDYIKTVKKEDPMNATTPTGRAVVPESRRYRASVTDEIVRQLGGNRIFAMAFAFHANGDGRGNDGATLYVAPSARKMVRGRGQIVRVTLTAADTYTVRLVRKDGTAVAEVSDVYAAELRETVEAMTRLRLSL